jgi:hypothetical protein
MAAKRTERKTASNKVNIDNTSYRLLNATFPALCCKILVKYEFIIVVTIVTSSEVLINVVW